MDPVLHQAIAERYQQGCVFCSPHPALVLLQSENFEVCFDVAPILPGHLIIYSREHLACAGALPRKHMGELDALRQDVASLLRRTYGACTFYEHGRAGHCLSDGPEHRLCHHFHLHCVPGDHSITRELSVRFPTLSMSAYGELIDLYEQYGDYLYLEPDSGKMSFLVVAEEIERHLLRTKIAEHCGHPARANWRENADFSVLAEGMARVRADSSHVSCQHDSA
jgi:diadenosine tetraphosphate (Ap4A) HIT family hydrolase